MIVLLLALQLVRPYWAVPVESLAIGHVHGHTHISVTGRVDYTRVQDDSDLHIRLRSLTPGDTSFIVAECIPKLPCRRPRLGEVVTVRGVSRRDPEHGWWECHPVEEGP